MRRLFALGALLCLGASRPAWHGSYASDCAPYDGPAFTIRLAGPTVGETIELGANAPLAEARGTWLHHDRSAPNHAAIALCHDDSTGGCSEPMAGNFRIDRIEAGTMTGHFDILLDDGRSLSANFTARQASAPVACG